MYNYPMGLLVRVLGSGSKGNCVFISDGNTDILIDQGLSRLYVEDCLKSMGRNPSAASVLVTHAHSDHIGGIDSFSCRNGNNIYCSISSLADVNKACVKSRDRVSAFVINDSLGDFEIGGFTVSPFRVSHDVPCVGYSLYNNRRKVTVATDLGVIDKKTIDEISDSDFIILESNHDRRMVMESRYPAFLKKRILSEKGHLSNNSCSEALLEFAKSGVKRVVLAHLSAENNRPEIAFETAKKKIEEFGFYEGRDMKIDVAYQHKMTDLYEIV